MHSFVFDGKSSREYGLIISDHDVFSSPSLKVTQLFVPGRNGSLIQSEQYYENRTLKYDLWGKVPKGDSASNWMRKIKNWILSTEGTYKWLEDSRDPDFLMKAAYTSGLEFKVNRNQYITFKLNFTGKPFLYDRTGLGIRQVQKGSRFQNPFPYEAKPYLKITGSGNFTLYVNNQIFYFQNVVDYIELDSERMNVYKGTQNCNHLMTGDGFPILQKGENGIDWEGAVNKVELQPRWCSL